MAWRSIFATKRNAERCAALGVRPTLPEAFDGDQLEALTADLARASPLLATLTDAGARRSIAVKLRAHGWTRL